MGHIKRSQKIPLEKTPKQKRIVERGGCPLNPLSGGCPPNPMIIFCWSQYDTTGLFLHNAPVGHT